MDRTPKQRVLAKHPRAYSMRWADGRTIGIYVPHKSGPLADMHGIGYTHAKAWADAARRLK